MSNAAPDRWAEWLLRRRQGGTEVPAQMQRELEARRDRVLLGARLQPGDTLLDVGCGDGLIGRGARPLVGPAGLVIFSDISGALLARAQERCREEGGEADCRFLLAAADDLGEVESGSVDAVTTRSVLIYVADKPRALGEFHRVLRPGGRISLFEPINRYIAELAGEHELAGYDVAAVAELAAKVEAVYRQAEAPATGRMMDFDERDLVRWVREAGFTEFELAFEAWTRPTPPAAWEAFYHSSGNPLAPTLAEAAAQALTATETARLVAHLRPLVEQGEGRLHRAAAFLSARK